MDSLFVTEESLHKPLAIRMRPEKLDELYGHEDIVGPGTYLRSMIENDTVPSLLLYGPCGIGKTTLAMVIAQITKSQFMSLNATSTGIGELRSVADEARKIRQIHQKRTILFLDEIHRFNKSQQDVLLPFVEDGTIVLIGATTENPFFEINRPLLSRLTLISLAPLSEDAIVQILQAALKDKQRGLGAKNLQCQKQDLVAIATFVNGDARTALNLLEQAAALVGRGGTITQEEIEKVMHKRIHAYDKKGDNHYDTISAFIKSMRGSDPQATLHYLARMIEAGEDPSYIARRIVICAAEDVGLADPQALVIANAAAQGAHFVGFPEARILLAEAAVYIALAPKSNRTYIGINKAIYDVNHKICGAVPTHLRDRHHSPTSQVGDTKPYQYAHDYPNGYVKQQYLPDALVDVEYYEPTSYGMEGILVKEWKSRTHKK